MSDSFDCKLSTDPSGLGKYISVVNGIRYVNLNFIQEKLGHRNARVRQTYSRVLQNLQIHEGEIFPEFRYIRSRKNRTDPILLRFDCFLLLMMIAPPSKLPFSEQR
jgi:hypothetical protein